MEDLTRKVLAIGQVAGLSLGLAGFHLVVKNPGWTMMLGGAGLFVVCFLLDLGGDG